VAQKVDGEGRASIEEADYEVSTRPKDFGALLSLRTFDGGITTSASSRCYRVLQGRGSACKDCPLAAELAVGQTRVTVRPLRSHTETYEVVAAAVVEVGRAQIRLRRISAEMAAGIREAKAWQLAEKARLSQRERDVLKYLLMGWSIAEIATLLQIRPRTVKFHQANVLEKLGAESRGDLLRLVY
jgi:DNA-binding CsgD family transcriptional regulator